jgi:hypothetical protein
MAVVDRVEPFLNSLLADAKLLFPPEVLKLALKESSDECKNIIAILCDECAATSLVLQHVCFSSLLPFILLCMGGRKGCGAVWEGGGGVEVCGRV